MIIQMNRLIEFTVHTFKHLIYAQWGCRWCDRGRRKIERIEAERASARRWH